MVKNTNCWSIVVTERFTFVVASQMPSAANTSQLLKVEPGNKNIRHFIQFSACLQLHCDRSGMGGGYRLLACRCAAMNPRATSEGSTLYHWTARAGRNTLRKMHRAWWNGGGWQRQDGCDKISWPGTTNTSREFEGSDVERVAARWHACGPRVAMRMRGYTDTVVAPLYAA